MFIDMMHFTNQQELPAEPYMNGHVKAETAEFHGYHDDSDDVSTVELNRYVKAESPRYHDEGTVEPTYLSIV